MQLYTPYSSSYHAAVENRPEKTTYCWYFPENAFFPNNWRQVLQLQTREYFFVTHYEQFLFHGHLGRLGAQEPYFTGRQRGLTYFDDYEAGKKGYFAFDTGAIWRLESIMPVAPLIFILKKIDLTTMEDYQPGNTVSVRGTGNVVTTGTGNKVHISQMSAQGNLSHFKERLAEAKVPEDEIAEISEIVQLERPGPNGELPPRTQTWLNKMVGKATAGGWEIVVHTAGHLLAGFIRSYYGLPG